jgi:hypothetical protein
LRAIAAEHQHEGAALHGEFGANLQVIEARDDFFQIAGPSMFVIVSKEPWRAVTVIDYLIAGTFSLPARNAAALDGASIKAIFFG